MIQSPKPCPACTHSDLAWLAQLLARIEALERATEGLLGPNLGEVRPA